IKYHSPWSARFGLPRACLKLEKHGSQRDRGRVPGLAVLAGPCSRNTAPAVWRSLEDDVPSRRIMPDAKELVVSGVEGNLRQRCLGTADLFLAYDIARLIVDPVKVVYIDTYGEHRVGGRIRSRRLHQLNIGVGAGEVVSSLRCDAVVNDT